MKHPIINYKFLLAHRASAYPFIYTHISRMLSNRDECYTNEHTQIVIDGFPRCANTYATYAFETAQPVKLIMAHHIHKQSQFIVAEKYNIPCILLIREPLECISSLIVRQPKYDYAVALKGYYLLYNNLLKYNNYVVGNFENVLNDYASVIKQLNQKFGSNFTPYDKTEANEKKVKQIVQTQNELIGVSDYLQRVAYPTEERKAATAVVKTNLQKPMFEKLLLQCREIYQLMLEKK